jgi:hypothetical protein
MSHPLITVNARKSELKARLERLETENAALKALLADRSRFIPTPSCPVDRVLSVPFRARSAGYDLNAFESHQEAMVCWPVMGFVTQQTNIP